MTKHLDYLWYIIPGTLLLFPLIFIQRFEELFGTSENFKFIPFILLAFTGGYIMHTVYRITYNVLILYYRPLIGFLKNELKNKPNRRQTEYLYNYFIYTSNKENIKSRIVNIRHHSHICSSLSISFLATIVGLIFLIVFNINHFLVLPYFIIAIIFMINWSFSFHWLNKKEITLTKFHLNEFNKNKVNKLIKQKI